MKKFLLFFMLSLLLPIALVIPQSLMDFVSAVKGDTLVIKDYYDMVNQPIIWQIGGTLYHAMLLDSVNIPAGRVYELKANGYYPLPGYPKTRKNTIIVGEDNTILVNNKNETSRPPILCGDFSEGSVLSSGISFAHDLTVRNCIVVPGTPDGFIGWTFFDGQADSTKLTLENCLLEQTRWVFMTTEKKDISWHIKDCYFVNMNDNLGRRSGGVLHIMAPQDTLLVENSTHIMAQGYLYRFWSYPFKRIIFNHNTFVNCANVVFQDYGSQSAMSVTNNIFVNCNVKPYVGIGHSIDPVEEDIDHLPVGIVNTYSENVDRKYLVDNNAIYWDPRLAGIVDTLNAKQLNGSTDWVSQMITMNQRTQSLFDDNANYPYLTEGTWYRELPNFTNSRNLLTTQVDSIKAYVIPILDTAITYGLVLPDWRLISTNVFPDWPIPVDLSYDNAVLLSGASGGFPVGDLNWFPAQKAAWLVQRDAEYAYIDIRLNQGIVEVKEIGGSIPAEFKLDQNYPNPFNPSTIINFSIPKAGYVILKVYDISGQEVATLLDGFKPPQNYIIKFDATGLAAGIYFYRLIVNGYEATRKMVLMK